MRAKIFGDFTFVNKKVPKLKNKGHFIITTLKVEKAKVVLFLRFGHYLYPKIENRVRKFYYIKTLPDVKTSCTMLKFIDIRLGFWCMLMLKMQKVPGCRWRWLVEGAGFLKVLGRRLTHMCIKP